MQACRCGRRLPGAGVGAGVTVTTRLVLADVTARLVLADVTTRLVLADVTARLVLADVTAGAGNRIVEGRAVKGWV